VGYQAGYSITTGTQNTAIGSQALDAATTGSNTVAIGFGALGSCTTGSQNLAVGVDAGRDLTTGLGNTFVGRGNSTAAGYLMTTGSKNTIIGGYSGNQGGLDIRTSSNYIVLSDGDGNPRMYLEGANGGRPVFKWTAAVATAQFWNEHSDPYGHFIYFNNASPDNNLNYFLNCSDSTTDRFRVYSDGDVVNHDNSYGAISDAKLKEQITDASSQWDDIKSLNIRKYKMKSDVSEKGDSDEHWRLGVIAQELEEAGMSGLVKESTDTDRETNEDLGTTTKTVKYSILYMKAVKALQEAMDRIETLEAKVTALENQ
jgi:hypothetical protein